MNLVLATPLFPPESGGPATYSKLLTEHLPEKGDELVLIKFSDVRYMPKAIRHFSYFWKVYVAGRDADVIFALDPVSTGLPAMLAARILGKPFVVKIVGDFAWEQGTQRFGVMATLDEFVKQERTPFAVACMRAVQTLVARSATRIIVPSNYLKGIITAWSPKISPDKISVIYNSIELPHIEVRPPSDIKVGPRAALRIVSVGRLVPWKGMEGLIDAIEEIQKNIPNISLTIVGDGPDKNMLEEKGRKQLGSAITFTGALSHAETMNMMQSADVYVQNSSYEGLSHQLIEALMLGRAIVATDVGGNPELIQDEDNGLLIHAEDVRAYNPALVEAVIRLLGDEELRARLGAHALVSSANFRVPAMIEKTHRLLSSLIS